MYHAGIYRKLNLSGKIFIQVAILMAIMPTTAFMGRQFSKLASSWETALWSSVILTGAFILWPVPEKLSVVRVFQLFIASRIHRLHKHMKK